MTTVNGIVDNVLKLPRTDRGYIAQKLIESLDDDAGVSEAWQEELNRRAKDIDEGTTELIDGDEVWHLVNKRFGTDF